MRNGQLYSDTNFIDEFHKSSRLFTPLMTMAHKHTDFRYNDDSRKEYSDASGASGSELSNTPFYQALEVKPHSLSSLKVNSPIYDMDEATDNFNVGISNAMKGCDQLDNSTKKLTAKNRKLQADIEKRNSLTSDGKYECAECKQQFETNFKLQYHKKSAHEERKFKCETCLKAFLTSHHLKMHSAIHAEVKPFSCDKCSASFRYKKLLDRHKTAYHIATPESCTVANDVTLPFACSQCELHFATRNAYNHHTKSHKTENLRSKLLCNICGKMFLTVEALTSHQVEHDEEKKLLCQICNKTFSHKKYLQVHQRIHSGLKPYICSTCGKTFTQASTLTVHRRYHSGERPYTCNLCDKGFVTRTIMLTHMKKHQ